MFHSSQITIMYHLTLPPERNKSTRMVLYWIVPSKCQMSNIVTIKGQSIDLADRKVQCEQLGKQCKVNASAEEYIKMCDERIKSYEMYISNLRELKQLKLTEKANERKDELKALLASMSSEERAELIDTLNQ